jgi:biopolymer transport protein ExbB
MNGFIDFIQSEFLHAAPILACGAFGLAIIIERVRTLFLALPLRDTQGFFDKITELVMAGRMADAIAFCDRFPGKIVAKIAKVGLMRAHQPENLLEHGIELEVGRASQQIQKRTSFLGTIANVATLLGLFGTIAGLIHSFEAVGHADPQQKSALLAAGISTAMNATMLGLAVAIPCLIAFSFLMNKSSRLIAEAEQGAINMVDILKQRYYAGDALPNGKGHELTAVGENVEVAKPRSNGAAHARRAA